MENFSHPVSSFLYTRETALRTSAGVAGSPYMAAGLLLGYFLLGVATVTWAFWSQRSRLGVFKNSLILSFSFGRGHLRGVQNVHYSLMLLLTIEAVNAITAVVLAIQLATSACNNSYACNITLNVWMVLRWDVLVLHLQTALVAILYLCNPQWGARLRLVTSVVVLLLIVCSVLYRFLGQIALLVLEVLMIGLALTITIKTAVSAVPPAAAFWKKMIACVAVFTFLFFCAPTFVVQCLMISSANSVETADKYLIVFVNLIFFINFHLLMDGLLCFCILKLPTEEEEQQQQQQQEPRVENPNYVISSNVN